MNSRLLTEIVFRSTGRRQTMTAAIVAAVMLMLQCAFATAPVLLDVRPNPVGTEIYLHFSESLCPGPLNNVGATHIPNYTLTPLATISAATLLADQRTVRLDFAPALNGSYTLQLATLPTFGIYDCATSNQMATPVTQPFVVNGTITGPSAFYVTPVNIGTDCGATVTVHGSGFDATAEMELIPGPIAGASPVVNLAGTTITATFPGGITPGAYSVVVKNPLGATVFPGQNTAPYAILVQPVTIQSSWPLYVGGCSGSVNITAYGGGFCPGVTFDAVEIGGSTIVPGTLASLSPGGDQIRAAFDFSLAPPHSYSLVVHNPGGGSATALGALDVSGVYAWSAYPNRVGNCGMRTLLISGAFCSGDLAQLVPNAGGAAIPGSVSSVVPATWWGEIMTADFNLAGASPGVYHVEVKRGASAWVATTVLVTILPTSPCPLDIQIVGRNTVGYTVVNTFTLNVHNISCAPVAASTLTLTVPASATPSLSAATAGGIIAPANVITYNIPLLNAGAVYPVQFDMLLPIIGTAINLSAASTVSGCGPALHPITVAASQDPNSKEGLAGSGPNHRIVGNETLPYEIHFENDPLLATAPAQDVFINDRLNPAQFDLSTFSLGDITFGSQVITPPSGLTSYSDILPFDMDGNPATTTDQLLLVIDAKLIINPTDPDYGRVTWSYRSLDPATLSTPTYILLGFLPPNQFPPMGEGSVKFSVNLKPGLAFGTQFGSAAVIIFDQNPPMYTNPWFNEISPPTTLNIKNNMGQIELTWVGAPGDWILEGSLQLGGAAAWSPVSATPVSISGGRQLVTLGSLDQQHFFRLRR